MSDDGDLLKRSQRGDLDAFGELVRRHEGWLRAFLRSRLSDWTAADDLAQDAFVTAFRKIRRFRGESSFETWLRGIALNHFRNFIRKRKELLLGGEALELILDQENAPQVESHAALEALRICLRKIEGKSRDLLERRYSQGESVRTIAEDSGLGYSAVTMKLHRLRLALAECVNRQQV